MRAGRLQDRAGRHRLVSVNVAEALLDKEKSMQAARSARIDPAWTVTHPNEVEPSCGAPPVRTAGPIPPPERDVRLDFFRGLALLFIFLDHIPFNRLSWLTIHNYGFSDAAEIFIFISGYAAALTYGRTLHHSGFRAAAARMLRRCGELYIAHIVLLVLFAAQVGAILLRYGTAFFVEEMQVIGLFQHPPEALVQALLLKFRPAFFDILPLYIVLLLAFSLVLWALDRWPWRVGAAAGLLYAAVQVTQVNLPAYPPGMTWNFNPLAWQFLFVLGALCARRSGCPEPLVARRPLLLGLAGAVLGVAGLVSVSAHLPLLAHTLPAGLDALPVAKPNLAPLRLLHFFALAYVAMSLLGPRPALPAWWLARSVIRCGQHSLPVFCAGILLSLTAHMVLVMVSDTLLLHALVSVTGIVLLLGYAQVLGWFRRTETAAGARDRARAVRPVTTKNTPPAVWMETPNQPRAVCALPRETLPNDTDLQSASGPRLRVLIVEDHDLVRDALVKLFADEADIEVVGEAANGRIAVALTRQLEPEVVLMDIHMPEMDGIEATKAIRADWPGICVIGLSMEADSAHALAIRDAGARACLPKTRPLPRLLDDIRRWAGSSRPCVPGQAT
jgi:CheY-like chemotaxis protein